MGYIKQVCWPDVFVVLDNVQLEKQSWQTRNRIKGPNGPMFLTVPTLTKGKLEQKICEARINNASDWRRKHTGTFVANYRKAPHFEEIMAAVRPLLEREWEMLLDFNLAVLRALCALMGFKPNLHFASEIEAPNEGRNEYLINVCKHFGAERYVSNDGSAAYLEPEKFARSGVTLEFMRYRHPEYAQLFGDFVSHLSVLDVLFNMGPKAAAELIFQG